MSPGTAHQLAFEHTSQAIIVFSAGNGKAELVNKTACKLLGYSMKEFMSKNIQTLFATTNNYKKIKQYSKKEIVTTSLIVIKKNGKHIPCEVTYSFYLDSDGAKKGIVNILDMSQHIRQQSNTDKKNRELISDNIILTKSKQKQIDTKKEKIVADNIALAKLKQKVIDIKNEKVVADNIIIAESKQKIIDTKNEKAVADNIVIAELKQKVIDVRNRKTVADNITLAISKQKALDKTKEKIVADNIILAKSRQKVIDTKKEKIVADNIILAKSKQKIIDTKKEKIVSQNIIQAQSKSDEEKLMYEHEGRNKMKAEIEEIFMVMFNSSTDALSDSNLLEDKLIVNDVYENEFGYTKIKKTSTSLDWSTHIHPDDKERVMLDYSRVLQSADNEWKCAYRFLKEDGSVANLVTSRIILRDINGEAYRMIGSVQDISKQRVLEERLEEEIKLKEKQIAEASEDAKDTERSEIGKELHDNVNQLLGVSKLYLDMARRGGENSEMYLNKSSEYTLSAIEEIRKLTKSLVTDVIRDMGLRSAIENIATESMEINPVKIALLVDGFVEKSVNDKFKLNILRIVQEQLNNILKHSKATKVSIKLLQNKRSIKLTIADNGVGFDLHKKRKGIGVMNIKSRAETYNGTADFVSAPGKGCTLIATFSVMDSKLKRAS